MKLLLSLARAETANSTGTRQDRKARSSTAVIRLLVRNFPLTVSGGIPARVGRNPLGATVPLAREGVLQRIAQPLEAKPEPAVDEPGGFD